MKAVRLVVLSLCFVITSAAVPITKYGVTVTAAKNVDFAKFKSYMWEPGWKAPNPDVHAAITAAVDRELAALGLQKQAAPPSDVVVTYASLRRVDVDLKSKPDPETGLHRKFDVGTLVLLILEPGTRHELFRARVDKPIEASAAQAQSVIDGAVAEIFLKYPTRTRKP